MDLQAVWAMRQNGDIKGLIEAARSQNGSVRKEAIHELKGFYGSPQRGEIDPQLTTAAVQVLIAALKDEHSSICEEASQALGNIGDARAVAALTEVLQHTLWEDRYYAAMALGQIGDESAIPALEAAKKDEHMETFYDWNNVRRKIWPVRTAAREALVKIKSKG